ncbi:unnamed protein product [Rotaria sp. Silwood2]|nr:unnamed protein product [Rotaria sp. Silwood2]
MSNSDKDSIRKRLDSGEYKSCDKPATASAVWWTSFNRIQDEKENFIPYVICIHCKSVLAYDSQKTDSKTLKLHFENCKSKLTITTPKITAHFTSEKYNHVASDHKKKMQTLLDVAYLSDGKIKASDIIPDPTTISRRVQSMACDERRKLIITLKNDIEQVKLFGITCDYWKNTYTSESFLTINIHYGNDYNIKKFALKTMLFSASKTGENTWKAICNTLESYGLHPDGSHIIFITDNASNLINALQSEAHIRCVCVCHCINLAVQQAIENCYIVNLMVKHSRELVSHFKRCELQQILPTTLKHDCVTRWNSIFEMLNSILLNFTEIELTLDDRKEVFYLDNINRTFLIRPGDTAEITDFKNILLNKLDDEIWLSEFHYIATFLHPETKSLNVSINRYKYK